MRRETDSFAFMVESMFIWMEKKKMVSDFE